jgi:lipopolysaccharide transport system ATP-binding protein
LIYQGLSRKEIEAAVTDIAEFTELGPFLNQPFKTYSTGMQARLTFAAATAINPNILIIDEILGAGDSYFFNKSQERMSRLVENSGASVLIVSHALDQITRFCEEAIWIERGRIVKRGPAMEIVDDYQRFIRVLDDRRLKAKNKKVISGRYLYDQYDQYGDSMLLTFQLLGQAGASAEISEVRFVKSGQIEETLKIGDVQDTNPYDTAHVLLQGSQWSEPRKAEEGFCRGLLIRSAGAKPTIGYAVVHAYGFFEGDYEIQVRYRSTGETKLSLTLSRKEELLLDHVTLPGTEGRWDEWKTTVSDIEGPKKENEKSDRLVDHKTADVPVTTGVHCRQIIRWPSDGSITIESVVLLDENSLEKTVFQVGDTLIFRMTVKAHRAGYFDFVPTATLYRMDGIFISNFIGPSFPLQLEPGDSKAFQVELSPLNLGDGHYVFSTAIYEKTITEKTRYDLIARVYEFQVVGGNPLLASAVFEHSSRWASV